MILEPSQSKRQAEEQATAKTAHREYTGATIKLPIIGQVPLSLREISKDLQGKENTPLWAQFFKYAIFGVLSAILFAGVIYYIQFLCPDYLDTKRLTTKQLNINLSIALFCAFVPANLFTYAANRIFVFTPGKYSLCREFTYFIAISAISFIAGELGKRAILAHYAESVFILPFALLSFVISAALINFTARKYVVFAPSSDEVDVAQN